MPWIIDPETGDYVEVSQEQLDQAKKDIGPSDALTYNNPWAREQDLQQQTQVLNEQQMVADNEGLQQSLGGDKPFLSGDIGDIAADAALISGNALFGLATDVGDLVSYVGDLGRAAVDVVDGGGFNEDNYLFNDADNPWTKLRVDTFERNYRTGAAKGVGDIVRLGTSLLLGGGAIKVGAKVGIGVGKRIPVLGKLGTGAVGKLGLPDLLAKGKTKWANFGREGQELDKVLDAMNGVKSKAGQKAIKGLRNNTWLSQPYMDVAKRARQAGPIGKGIADDIDRYVNGVIDSVGVFKGYAKLNNKLKIKTFGEAFAWDLFATFQVMGEGNAELDETFGNMINDAFGDNPMGMGWLLSNVTTVGEDDAITRKFKGALDGLLMGGVLNTAFDMARIFRFSKNYAKAKPAEQMELLSAFGERAQGIGGAVSEGLDWTAMSGYRGQTVDGVQDPWTSTDELVDALGQARQLNQETDAAQFARTQLQDPWSDDYLTQYEGSIGPQQAVPEYSPVQARLAEMEGMASGINPDDALYSQALEGMAKPGTDAQVQEQLLAMEVAGGLARLPEPVFNTPTIGGALKDDLRARMTQMMSGVYMAYPDVMQRVTKLLPNNRVDAFDYLQQSRRMINEAQTLPLEEGLISDAVYATGLDEGWIRVTPEGDILGARNRAVDVDEGILFAREGKAIDDAAAYDRWLAEQQALSPREDGINIADPANAAPGVEQGPGPASEYLNPERRNIQNALEQSDIGLNPEVQDALNPVRGLTDDVTRQADDVAAAKLAADEADAARKLEQYQAAEEKRFARYKAVSGIARRFLDSEQVPVPQVVKGDRGWDVIDETGEVIANARTKTLAEGKAKKAVEARRREMRRQLDQQQQDDTFIPISADSAPAFSDNITGKVSFSDAQLRAVSEIDPKLADEIAADAAAGGKVKRTYELSQMNMKRLSDDITALLDDGDLPPNRKQTLRSLRDQLDTKIKTLSPDAALDNYAKKAVRDVLSLITDGKICNPLDT